MKLHERPALGISGAGRQVTRDHQPGLESFHHASSLIGSTGAVALHSFPYHLFAGDKKKAASDRIKLGPMKVELRVTTVPTKEGLEDIVMRVLGTATPVPIEQVGFDAQTLAAMVFGPGAPVEPGWAAEFGFAPRSAVTCPSERTAPVGAEAAVPADGRTESTTQPAERA